MFSSTNHAAKNLCADTHHAPPLVLAYEFFGLVFWVGGVFWFFVFWFCLLCFQWFISFCFFSFFFFSFSFCFFLLCSLSLLTLTRARLTHSTRAGACQCWDSHC